MNKKLILIGASTGGPGQLKEILIDLPSDLKVPIVIAQHMGAIFISSFVDHFNNIIGPKVQSTDGKKDISEGGVYICRKSSVISSKHPLTLEEDAKVQTLYNPNINILFNSVTKFCKDVDVLAVLMTGIGDDGASGLYNIAQAGGKVYGEDEKSSIVYGMPKKAKEFNPELRMLSLKEIKNKIMSFIDV